MITCTAFGTIAEGDAVCVHGYDAGTYPMRPVLVARASRTNLGTSKTVFGVATAAADDTTAVDVLVAGDVATTAISTGLAGGGGAGTSRLVVTDITQADANPELQCRLKRMQDPGATALPPRAERFVVGTCDESGNVAVQPRHSSDETGSPKVYNVRAYGAVDLAESTDAFNAAIAAANAAGGGIVYVPQGTYTVSGALTTFGSGVWLVGETRGVLTGYGSNIVSTWSMGNQEALVKLYDSTSDQGSLYNGVRNIRFVLQTTSIDFSEADMVLDAPACIQATGGALFTIENCEIEGFPIGIVLDTVNTSAIRDCGVADADGGYPNASTKGIGILVCAGGSRRWAAGTSSAQHWLQRCVFNASTKTHIKLIGTVETVVEDCLWEGNNAVAMTGIEAGGCNSLTVQRCFMEEGFQNSGTACIRTTAGMFQMRLTDNELLGTRALKCEGDAATVSLISSGNLLGAADGEPAIEHEGRITFATSNLDLVYPGHGILFTDHELANAGFCISQGPDLPIGVSVNRLSPATAMIDGTRTADAPLVKVRDTNGALLFQQDGTPTKAKLQHLQPNGAGTSWVTEAVSLDESLDSSDVASIDVPDGCVGRLTWTVVQWRATDVGTRSTWYRRQTVTRYAGSPLIQPSAIDTMGPDQSNSGTYIFQAPAVVVSGNTVMVRVYAILVPGVGGMPPTRTPSRAQVNFELQAAVQ